jgi:pyroglutamyl-peptidase
MTGNILMSGSSHDRTERGNTRKIRILVTGFGPFPGAKSNPTGTLIRRLETEKPRFARLGIALVLEILPTIFAEVAPRLEALERSQRPDAILHLGLATRRKVLCVETRAVNRVNLLRFDMRKTSAKSRAVLAGAPPILRARFPAPQIAAALSRANIPSRLSIHAGRYVCNQTFYLSLALSPAKAIGFIHVPRPASAGAAGRPSLDDLTRAVRIAILVTATSVRRSTKEGTAVTAITQPHICR